MGWWARPVGKCMPRNDYAREGRSTSEPMPFCIIYGRGFFFRVRTQRELRGRDGRPITVGPADRTESLPLSPAPVVPFFFSPSLSPAGI